MTSKVGKVLRSNIVPFEFRVVIPSATIKKNYVWFVIMAMESPIYLQLPLTTMPIHKKFP